jgi:hypothetical protein
MPPSDSPKVGSGLRRVLTGFLAEERAIASAVFVLVLPLLIGASALAVEVGIWTVQKRLAQGVADQAAFSAASARKSGLTETRWRAEAKGVSADLGFVDGANGVVVTVNNPPTAGAHAGDSSAIEVRITQPQKLYLARMFMGDAPSVIGRSVAMSAATDKGCILGLNPTAPQTVFFDNNATSSNKNCAVYSNSSSSDALHLDNNAVIAGSTYVVGQHQLGNNAKLNGAQNKEGAAATADPYAGVNPSAGSCTVTATVTKSGTLNPGHYCGGIDAKNNITLNLNPGVYYIDSKFTAKNNLTLTATGGVTIVINGNYPIDLGNNAAINITAPTTGDTAGIAMMGPRGSSVGVTQNFANNANLHVQGALYFPSQTLKFDNNTKFDSALCTQVIASIVQLSNNANMSANCPNTGMAPIGGSAAVKLVE